MDIRIADRNDIELMMSSRLEMLREVNSLDADYQYDEAFVEFLALTVILNSALLP